MKFFKKVGRPTDEEQMMIDAINNVIQDKGLSLDDVPDCNNLDDLLAAIDLIEGFEQPNNEIIQEQEESVQNLVESEERSIDSIEPEPLPEQLVSFDEAEQINEEVEPVQEIQSEFQEQELPNFENDEYDPFAEPIVERSYNQAGAEQEKSEASELDLDETGDTPLDDLNPRTKRRAAEQTADAILKGYSQFAPEPFKWLSKFSESKIEQAIFNGEIDPSIEVEQGVRFDDYIKEANEQVDEIFEVQEETLDEIKEPLIEVLMEQEMELTPQQRLTMAIVGHLIQMFTMAMKLFSQNKRILEYQKHLTHLANQRAA